MSQPDPHSMAHFRKLLKLALERIWWRQNGAAYRKTVSDFRRSEREGRIEARRLEPLRRPERRQETD